MTRRRRRGWRIRLLGVLLLMTALSGFIGWSSHATIIRVYDETVRTLTAAGKPAPPNPFSAQPRLSLLNNMIIYVPLIGALLARGSAARDAAVVGAWVHGRAGESLDSTVSALSRATSTACSTEIPTSAACNAGASLMPSPR